MEQPDQSRERQVHAVADVFTYNTPQEADYIEGTQDGEEFRVDNAKIYPNPPEWSYNSITIYPSGKDVSQTYVGWLESESCEGALTYHWSSKGIKHILVAGNASWDDIRIPTPDKWTYSDDITIKGQVSDDVINTSPG